ncbi:phosphatase PAP2 family protein, partial [Streptomyces solincola]|uniref:phosphatase PAP2 family protein n=1 Tax=Streptomyces solincola TaxID=2100817 RepID=UPI0021595011
SRPRTAASPTPPAAPGVRTAASPTGPAAGRRPSPVRELLLVAALFTVYKVGRLLANGHPGPAYRNAEAVWHLERAAQLPGEGLVQDVLLRDETAVHLANTYYAAVHFPATAAFLLWLYWRRPAHYRWARRALALLTGGALALHLLLPLAPPRLLASTGLVDTAQRYGPSVYGASPASDSLANQFAAMPSLHVGWALMVAVGMIAATRTPLRWLWLLHPLLTLLVVVGTANHYWLDAAAAVVLLGGALLLLRASGAGALRTPALTAPAGVVLP